MVSKRVKISSIVENQLPSFIREDFPLLSEFLSQYYISLENQGGVNDLLQNIDQYIKVDELTNLVESSYLLEDVDYSSETITVSSTNGFPDSYGLIKINSEIITYTSKNDFQFLGCIRGFSGVTSYRSTNVPDQLVFSQSEIDQHLTGSTVFNLSVLFLKEFFEKVKKQFSPGFDSRSLSENLNQNIFIKQSQDFYRTKGTDESFRILFNALYGEPCDIIRPKEYLFNPSNSRYETSQKIVVEPLLGNPLDLINLTIRQDETEIFSKALGVVNNVERILKGEREYYILSLDYNHQDDYSSVFGAFSVHPKTKALKSFTTSDTIIDVDSTIGFPKSGTLKASLSDGTEFSIFYRSKNLNQFIDCAIGSDISSGQELRLDAYAYYSNPRNESDEIRFRICSILSDIEVIDNSYYYEADDIAKIDCLGINSNNLRDNNWIFNVSTSYDVKTVEKIDLSNFTYKITTYDENIFTIGDSVTLISSDGVETLGSIASINNKKSFVVSDIGSVDVSKVVKIKKNISKTNSINFAAVKDYISNVQNTYTDYVSTLVASNSLPDYVNLDVNDRSVYLNGTFNGTDIITTDSFGKVATHGFETGDAVYYTYTSEDSKLNISSGIYFIKKVDLTTLKIASSRANLFGGKYISVSGSVSNNKLSLLDFYNKSLNAQKILRKISSPINDSNDHETNTGYTGILVNGVEILNYKSNNYVNYGSIEKIEVLSPGKNYDVINPPQLSITDSNGSGAIAYCEVEGYLDRIDIIDPGFDYIEEPIISINGGNGYGANAKANLITFEHSVDFNASPEANVVDLSNNTIAFSTYHKFRDAEQVVYNTYDQNGISGLSTSSVYYVSVKDNYTVGIHTTFEDASVGINTVDLKDYGVGNHAFTSKNLKKRVGSISVENSGGFYKNRKVVVGPTGINTASNTILAKNHRYLNGDIISYSYDGTQISGLSSSLYYVTKVSEDEFKLSPVGVGTTNKDFYYSSGQYSNLISQGTGEHIFNHEPITLKIEGNTGVSTITSINTSAILQPVFRGTVKSIFVSNGGVGYGSSEIIDYDRQPSLTFSTGSKAELIPIISGYSISQVIVKNSGSGYFQVPDLVVTGYGEGAILTPVIQNGSLVEVKVVNGGSGYLEGSTDISVVSKNEGCKLYAKIKSWNVNLFEKLLQANKISSDDGVISTALNKDSGLQYSHLYCPRPLRQKLLTTRLINGELTYIPDLRIVNNKELSSTSHSPIIGWAYDGNPIYGPYGYSGANGSGVIREMVSGYELIKSNEIPASRPSENIFPLGFFVEDYAYKGSGDLDEYNGRFCVTPEYPNGVYAYFSTISKEIESSGPFTNFKKPSFPYFVGNKYKSNPIDFNFDLESNQDDFDFSNSLLVRNTFPYNLTKKNSYYDFLNDKNEVRSNTSKVKHTLTGTIDSVGIITGGTNYFVGESVAFNNQGTGGVNASAYVSVIKGKPVSAISVDSRAIRNVEFYPSGSGSFIGFSTSPHNLTNRTLVTVSGINTVGFYLKDNYAIGVKTETFFLLNAVGDSSSTGIVTYFSVDGNLNFPSIVENDVLGIGTEKVKVISIDKESSRIKVIRQYDGTVSSAHTATTQITENPRKMSFSIGFSTSSSFVLNKEIYFDPKESVGVGTIFGPGIGVTITFSNPGVGITQIFIPTKSIYLPNHGLLTGDRLIYNSNGGTPVSISTDGVSSYQLTDNQVLYAAKLSSDLVGISTIKVGIGSTGTFVGINSTTAQTTSYIVSVGSGVVHSFKTDYDNVLKGTVNSNVVTVSTASTHGLEDGDKISLDASPGINTTITIAYNDHNRRLVVNPRTFSASGINTITNQITITGHQYYTGQKVIHTASSSAEGLKNNEIYYVIVDDENTFRLTDSFYEASKYNPTPIDIKSTSTGTISQINPQIILKRNQTVIFDLSNSSLSYSKQSTQYSAFEFNLYTDSLFKNKFISTKSSSSFDVIKTGSIGIDADARVVLKINDNTPKFLYYSLDPIRDLNNTNIKKEIIKDSDFNQNNNLLSIELSEYFGSYNIVGVGSTSFKFNLLRRPESNYYTQDQGTFEYITNSTSAFGEIHSINITSNGRGYKSLPGITSVFSDTGTGCILEPSSNTIGKIKKIEIEDFGFDYPTDITLKPTGKLPDIIKLSPLSSFEKIGISSVGKYYTKAPNLVIIDTVRGEILNDIDLSYSLGDTEVSIRKNTYGIYDSNIKIIPINNSNGIGISSISYNSSTKDVTIVLSQTYSTGDVFPFSVGDKVIIENTSVGVASTGRGYNSENYGYSLFTLTQVDAKFGGTGAYIAYNLTNYLNVGETPGVFSINNSSGSVTPEHYFPIFTPVLRKNNFLVGETVFSENYEGTVEKWDSQNEYIKISSFDNIEENQIIEGKTSNSKAKVIDVKKTRVIYSTGPSLVKNDGWKNNSGFLNDDLQRIQDSDYYQNMSYAIKSKISYDTWEEAVNTLNHTLGFKKFGDLVIESVPSPKTDDDDGYVGIKTSQDNGDFIGISDLTRTVDLNCFPDFDLVTENNLKMGSNVISNQVFFKSRILQDYFESVGNRVLTLDDISNEFNSTPRSSPFSVVDTFTFSPSSFKKYITWVRDKRFTAERQVCLFTLLQDESNGYINEYAKVYTVGDMGTFDFGIFGSDGQIRFYPEKYEINNFDVSLISYNIENVFSGIQTAFLGDIVKLQTNITEIPSGTTSEVPIVGIASTYRASKLLVSIAATDGSYYEINELTAIHDGTNVSLLEYGRLNDSLTASSGDGLGIYNAELSGSNLNVTFQPNVGLGVSFHSNVFSISIGNTGFTGVGTNYLSTGKLQSNYIQIPASASPSRSGIVSYSSDNYNGAYFIASVEDLTNNQYQVSEIVVVDDGTTANITEYGIVQTGSTIGTFDADISSSNVEIGFTPIANSDVQVRIFTNTIGLKNESYEGLIIDLTYASIDSSAGSYSGTLNDTKREFNLTSGGKSIFKQSFRGDLQSIVSITDDTITIPNHFFVTGEELIYSNSGAGTTSAIGIATTSIVGYGTTDKLPLTVYAIKVNESKIKLSGSAENALLSNPVSLDITSVGIGTSHSLTGTNQNQRVIISIDNVIQSPVVASAITTKLVSSISTVDDLLTFAGITSFISGDLIRIDSEIMKISTIGVGNTNSISVRRPWMGTRLKSHEAGSVITKINGNYNIVNDTINFAEAPYGLLPFSTSTNSPSERDYVGIATHSTFNGRVFMRSGLIGSTESTYSKNYIFDDISSGFNGITTGFTLKSNGQNISGFSTSNAIILVNQIFQQPRRSTSPIYIPGDYTLRESVGVTSIFFTGSTPSVSYDIQSSNVPVGGVIISVGSSSGLGYQPLVAAGGTALVSAAGTISLISIGNSGSGYRSGIQTVVNVGVATSSTGTPNIDFIGTAAISGGHIVSVAITNPGTGYTSTNPPIVIFDSPLSYSNIPLIYSSSSSGVGTEATVDIVVGQGSSVIDFEIKNIGYGYGQGQVLTVKVGGSTGIPTDTSYAFQEFKILVDRTYEDSFSGWSVGDFEVLDNISDLFDGVQKAFPIKFNDEFKTIRAKKGSNIDVQATLLVFLNDILQVPRQAYRFDTGSIIEFSESPKNGDTCKIIFYKGTGSVDVVNTDILETIKKGDDVTLNSDNYSYQEEERTVNSVESSDIVRTNAYSGVGISTDETFVKSVTWCRQTEDKFINGKSVAKDRTSYEPLIQPVSNIISNVGISTNAIYVESVRTFFDNSKENTDISFTGKLKIVSQDNLIGASATAVVSAAGTISSIIISDGGIGYSVAPMVTIANPVGLGTTQRANATSTISVGGTVSSVVITSPGTGYTTTNPPIVLIGEPPTSKNIESVSATSFEGDFGIISGIALTSVGVASTGIIFDLHIPSNSFLRDVNIVGSAITISGIQTGYYFVVTESNVGNGVTSLHANGSTVGIGTSFIDNVYRVASVSIGTTNVIGVGLTYVAKVIVSVNGYNGLSGIGYSNYYGRYSWGKINVSTRNLPKEFSSYNNNGVSGLSTSPIVERINFLKYFNYN